MEIVGAIAAVASAVIAIGAAIITGIQAKIARDARDASNSAAAAASKSAEEAETSNRIAREQLAAGNQERERGRFLEEAAAINDFASALHQVVSVIDTASDKTTEVEHLDSSTWDQVVSRTSDMQKVMLASTALLRDNDLLMEHFELLNLTNAIYEDLEHFADEDAEWPIDAITRERIRTKKQELNKRVDRYNNTSAKWLAREGRRTSDQET